MARADPLPRIAYISASRFPHADADTQQTMKNVAALVRAGVEIELLIPPRSGRALWPRARRLEEIAEFYGLAQVEHIRVLPGIPAGDFQPPVKMLHGALASLYVASREGALVYTRDPLPLLLCMMLGKRVIYETYRALGDEYPGLMVRLAGLARLPNFVGVITHSALAARSFIRAGFPPGRILVAHNGFDPADMQPRRNPREAREALGLEPGGKLVVYTGNMQPAKNLPVLVDVAARVPQARFLLVGGRPEHIEALRAYARSAGASNMRFTGQQPVAEIPGYLYAADVLIIPPTSVPLKLHGRTVLPIKTFSYLAAGRAILAPRQEDLTELLVDGQNARLVTPDRVAGAAAALRELLADDRLRDTLGAGALDTAKGLTWDARAGRIKSWLAGRLAGQLASA